ncbi:tyrosine recombinase [Myxococcota bacterium]|nr:tyrosine recombinase [Myxococcota bacterium]
MSKSESPTRFDSNGDRDAEVLSALLDAAAGDEDPSGLGRRDCAMLEVLYGGGFEVPELVLLPVDAVVPSCGIQWSREAGVEGARLVTLRNSALRALESYLEKVRPLLASRGQAPRELFLSKRGGAMTPQNFWDRLRGLAKRAGVAREDVLPRYRNTAQSEEQVPTRLQDLVDDFMEVLRLERGLPDNTVHAYQRDLRKFLRFLVADSVQEVRQIRWEHLHGFSRELAERGREGSGEGTGESGLKPSSQARALSAARSWLRHVGVEQGAARVEGPRQIRALPRVLDPEETRALIESAIPHPDVWGLGIRDRAMLEVLYGGGLRVSELVSVPLASLDMRSGLLWVEGKGSKRRIVTLGDPALEAIEQYLEGIRDRLALRSRSPVEALFLSRLGSPMTRQNFFARLRRIALRAGVPVERVSPHVLRHSFATDMIEGEADIRVVQSLLGHEDLATTQVYTHVRSSHLKGTVQNHHPRGRRGASRRG